MKINISGLNRAQVLVMLFNNAVKSDHMKAVVIEAKFPFVRTDASQYFKYKDGIDAELKKLTLTEAEAAEILKQNPSIIAINSVEIKIDFRGYLDTKTWTQDENIIDTTAYDRLYSPSVQTAESLLIKKHAPIATPSACSPDSNTLYFASIKSIKDEIGALLSDITKHKCQIVDLKTASFSEKAEAGVLEALLSFLQDKGFTIKYTPSTALASLGDSLFKTSPVFKFKTSLENCLDALKEYKEMQATTKPNLGPKK